MRKKALCDRLTRYSFKCVEERLDSDFADAVCEAVCILYDKDDESPKWIPVEERLPEEKGHYLVYWKSPWGGGDEVHESCFLRNFEYTGWCDPVEEYEEYHPTHWMPLPEPPGD